MTPDSAPEIDAPPEIVAPDFDAPYFDFASPLQRLSAAILDAALLLTAHIIALRWLPISVVSGGGLALGWLYLWFSWWRGATIGQRILRLRVITSDGQSPSAQRSALRCLSYALASWPLKIGLLPILWDKQRQGFHDRLAGTFVIRTHRSASTKTKAKRASKYFEAQSEAGVTAIASWPRPDWRFARRGWPLIALIYLVVAIGLTWPVAAHFSTHFAGGPIDNRVFAWNYWHFAHALSQGQPISDTDLLFWPHTVSLRFHTMQFHNCVLAWLLQRWLSLIQIYNALFLATFAANALAVYLAAASLTRDRWAALVSGLAFGFCPFLMTHSNGHANLLAAQYLPLFAVAFYGALLEDERRARRNNALLAALCLSLNAWCDWQYWFFALLIAGALWLIFVGAASPFGWSFRSLETWRSGSDWRHESLRRTKYFAAVIAVGTLPLLPLLWPMLQESGDARAMSIPPYYCADIWNWFKPSPMHPWTAGLGADWKPRGNEWIVAPGFVALMWALIGLRRHKQMLQPWLTLSLVAALLACGPTLVANRSSQFPALPAALLGGAPGNGFSSLGVNSLADYAVAVQRKPQSPLDATAPIALPFSDLRRALSPLKSFRVPARFAVLVALGVAMMAAFGLSDWRRRRPRRAAFFCALSGAALLLELMAVPYPLTDARIPDFYRRIGRDATRYAIIDAPMLPNTPQMSRYEWFQTAHSKPMFAAYISRPPRLQPDILHNNLLLLLAFYDRKRHGELDYLRELEAMDDSLLRHDLRQLQTLQARYFIVHRDVLKADQIRRLDQILHGRLGRKVLREGELNIYDLRD